MSHAVVIGGGIVGLAAARVLSEEFGSVTVIDKDPKLGSACARPGVPQGQHLHVLLAQGLRVLESLFPGVSEELA